MKKMIALITVLAIMSASVLSCDTDKPITKKQTETSAENTKIAETKQIWYTADVPDNDFGGEDFRVLGIDPDNFPAFWLDFDVSEANGDVINDVLYKRDRDIQEKYNVNFVSDYLPMYTDTLSALKKLSLSGSDDYEMVMVLNRDAFTCAQNNFLMPMSSIPYVDTTNPWYIQSINSQFTVCNKLFFAYTDECLNAYLNLSVVLFNKQLVNDNNMESPYALVDEGRWTVDNFFKMAISVVNDINGDGIHDENDTYGIVSEKDVFYPAFWVGAGCTTVKKDLNDIPSYTLLSDEKMIGLLQKIISWQNTEGLVFDPMIHYGQKEESRTEGSLFFADNHSLFRMGSIGTVFTLRGMDSDFGIVPSPKYDETQADYYTRFCDGWIHVVPITNTKLELTGTMLEALGAESKNTVIPAIFETALKTKYSRDNDSAEMLDIIFNNITVDLGDTIWQSSIRGEIQNQLSSGNDSFVSVLTSTQNKVNDIINKAVEDIGKLK